MHLDLACKHTSLTPGLRQAVETRFDRLSGHIDKPVRAHVILAIEDGGQHRAEAILHGTGTPVHAKAVNTDMYAALDKLVSLLDRRWRKRKTNRLRNARGRIHGLGK